MTQTATSRRNIVVRRKELVIMAAPWRALCRGRDGRAGCSSEKSEPNPHSLCLRQGKFGYGEGRAQAATEHGHTGRSSLGKSGPDKHSPSPSWRGQSARPLPRAGGERLRTATAARVDIAALTCLDRKRWLRSGTGHTKAARIDATALLAPETSEDTPDLVEKREAGRRLEGLRRLGTRGPGHGDSNTQQKEKDIAAE